MTEALIDRGVLAGTGYDRSTQYEDLNSLATALVAQQQGKRDYIVDTRSMGFTTITAEQARAMDGDEAGTILAWDDPDGGTASGSVNDHAHGQIAARLGIPTAYYKRMQTENAELLDTNVRSWFYTKPERRLVRTMHDRVRAFLSDRYRMLDNLDLMEKAIIPALQNTDGLHFQVASLTDEKLHINALLPGLREEIRVGDIVQAGVQIRNSEVGSGALSVTPRIWRLSCLNGLLVTTGALTRYHVGRKQDAEAYEIYRDDTLAADDVAFFLKVRDAIAAALSDTTFGVIVAQLREAATGERMADPVRATELLAKRYDLTDTEHGSVMRFLAEGGDLSRWGAINAVTAAAKLAPTYERLVEMETIGGELAVLPEREWAAVAA